MTNVADLIRRFLTGMLLFAMVLPLTAAALEQPADPSYGPKDAPVTVTLYYDFQCGYCGKTAPVLYDVVQEYKETVRLVTVNVPGPGHAYALPSAELALTAAENGKFWEAFTLLFANQSKLAQDDLIGYGKKLGLDETLVKNNLKNYAHRDVLKKNFYNAIDLGLTVTPTIFIGETKLTGVQDADALRYYLNEALEAKGIKSPVGPVPKPKPTKSSTPSDQVPKNMIYPVKIMEPTDSKLAVKVGDKAPDFLLPLVEGQNIRLSDFKGKNKVVLSFVPAAWTPVCSEQWPEYNDNKSVFENSETIIIGISVDNIPSLFSWTGTMGALWFPVASDFYPHGQVAKSYGVLRTSGVAERAVFLIDKAGIIRFIDVHDINSKPDLDKLLKALNDLEK